MNKIELARRLAGRLHISSYESITYLNALVDEMEATLGSGEPIIIQNFGSFTLWHQTERPGRNPKNGMPYTIPARTSVKFKPGKGMLQKLNPFLRIFACLLFLTTGVGCTGEQPEIDTDMKWIPVEINVASIEQMEASPMGTKSEGTELPAIVKTTFIENDELKLTYTLDGSPVTTIVRRQADGNWKKADGTAFMLPATPDNTAPPIKAEYGTEISDQIGYNTKDYLFADNVTPVYAPSSKTYSCSFSFVRPNDYSCMHIDIRLVDPGPEIGADEYVTYINAQFFTDMYGGYCTVKFPITDNLIEVFYKGAFTAYGVALDCSHGYGERQFRQFDEGNPKVFSFTVNPGHITNVLLVFTSPALT